MTTQSPGRGTAIRASPPGFDPATAVRVLARLPTATVVIDDRGRVSFLNPAAERLLGASLDALSGHRLPLTDPFGQPLEPSLVDPGDDCDRLHWERLRPTGPGADPDILVRASACSLSAPGEPFQGWVLSIEALRGARAPALEAASGCVDPVTRLPQPALFEDRVQQAILRARRYGGMVGLLCIALDGVQTGPDEVDEQRLRAVAEHLRNCLRRDDSVGRYPGDLLMVLLATVDGRRAIACAARRLLRELARPTWNKLRRFSLMSRVGIAVAPDDGLEAKVLIGNAVTAHAGIEPGSSARLRFFGADAEDLPR
jgi:diguanylate cyclase (GGDEF)-like protein